MENRKFNKKIRPKVKLEAVLEYRLLQLHMHRKQWRFTSVQQLCRELHTSRFHLRYWATLLDERAHFIFWHGSSARRKRDLAAENQALEKQVEILERENERLRNILAHESGHADDDPLDHPPRLAP
jgi:transposase-like protein